MMVPSRLLLLSVLVLSAGCGGSGAGSRADVGAGRGDTKGLSVVSTEPPNGSADVDFGAQIRVEFSGPIDARSVGALSFQVFADSSAISGAISASGSGAVFAPYSPLAESTVYRVVLSSAVTGSAGDRLEKGFAFHFTTRPGPFDYSLAILPAAVSVVTGGTAGIEISALATVGRPRAVVLSTAGCPPEASCTLLTSPLFADGASEGAISLRIVTTDATANGTYRVTVQGVPPSSNPAVIELSVVEPPAVGVPRNVWGDAGLSVCDEPHQQRNVVATTDGAGGIILAWEDARPVFDGFAPLTIFAQRIDAHGIPVWSLRGMPVATFDGVIGYPPGQQAPVIVPDGAGGAIIAWIDNRNSVLEAYAQRIDASGRLLWATTGVGLSIPCAQTGCQFQDKQGLRAAAVPSGGAVFAWGDAVETRVWVQRLDAAGKRLWGVGGGVAVVDALPFVVFDGLAVSDTGEAIVAWCDQFRVLAQKIGQDGTRAWAAGGIEVGAACPAPIVADGAGGAYLGWRDGLPQLRAQRIAFDGSLPWGSVGVPVSVVDRLLGDVEMAPDGVGGAFLVWQGSAGLLGQCLQAAGAALWSAGGSIVDAERGLAARIAPDGAGGAIAAWGGSLPSIRLQRLDAAGHVLWGTSGFDAHVIPGGNYIVGPSLVTAGVGRAIVGWNDYRGENTFPNDVSVQSVTDLP